MHTKAVGLFEGIEGEKRPPIILLLCTILPEEIKAKQFVVQGEHNGIFKAYNAANIGYLGIIHFDFHEMGGWIVEDERFFFQEDKNVRIHK